MITFRPLKARRIKSDWIRRIIIVSTSPLYMAFNVLAVVLFVPINVLRGVFGVVSSGAMAWTNPFNDKEFKMLLDGEDKLGLTAEYFDRIDDEQKATAVVDDWWTAIHGDEKD